MCSQHGWRDRTHCAAHLSLSAAWTPGAGPWPARRIAGAPRRFPWAWVRTQLELVRSALSGLALSFGLCFLVLNGASRNVITSTIAVRTRLPQAVNPCVQLATARRVRWCAWVRKFNLSPRAAWTLSRQMRLTTADVAGEWRLGEASLQGNPMQGNPCLGSASEQKPSRRSSLSQASSHRRSASASSARCL